MTLRFVMQASVDAYVKEQKAVNNTHSIPEIRDTLIEVTIWLSPII